jgi:hypothetical protein
MTDADRPALESQFTLSAGQRTEGTTFRYTLADTSTANIRALVTHPSVEDTANIDRADFRALAVPRLVSRRSLAFAAAGAMLLVACRRFLRLRVFWGAAAVLTVFAVLGARLLDPLGQLLLTHENWSLAAVIAAVAVLPAVRLQVPLPADVLRVAMTAPPVALMLVLAAATALAWLGVAPFWHDRKPPSLAAAAYEGDRVEVTRLLAAGVDPRASDAVDGRDRSALEAAIESGDDITFGLVLRAAGPLDEALRARLEDVAARTRNAGAATQLSAR